MCAPTPGAELARELPVRGEGGGWEARVRWSVYIGGSRLVRSSEDLLGLTVGRL